MFDIKTEGRELSDAEIPTLEAGEGAAVNALVRYDAARKALQAAHSVDEVSLRRRDGLLEKGDGSSRDRGSGSDSDLGTYASFSYRANS